MALLNHTSREITAKIVYYGPGLCGKTSNLQFIHENLEDDGRGNMLTLATEADRTLFFDFLPMDIGTIRDFKARVQLYTVPGQVFYEETRKRVLRGCDGVVFVADSQRTMEEANRESLRQLHEHLAANGLAFDDMPMVLQYNKRDLPDLLSIEDMDATLNPGNAPFFEAIASEGIGVEDTLKAAIRLVLKDIMAKGMLDKTAVQPAKPIPPGASPFPGEETPAPQLFADDSSELIAVADEDPFSSVVLPSDSGRRQDVVPSAPAQRVSADPEWLFSESAEETRALLADGAPAPVAFDGPPPTPARARREPEVAAATVENSAPTIRVAPGQTFEANLEIDGQTFRLRIELIPTE